MLQIFIYFYAREITYAVMKLNRRFGGILTSTLPNVIENSFQDHSLKGTTLK